MFAVLHWHSGGVHRFSVAVRSLLRMLFVSLLLPQEVSQPGFIGEDRGIEGGDSVQGGALGCGFAS